MGNGPWIAGSKARVDDLPLTFNTRPLRHVLGLVLFGVMAPILVVGVSVSISGLPDPFTFVMIAPCGALCVGCAWLAYVSYRLLRDPTKLTITRGGIRLENWKKKGGVNWEDMEARVVAPKAKNVRSVSKLLHDHSTV